MKGFSTKYALTQGLSEVEVDVSTGDLKYVYTRGRFSYQLVIGSTFFEDRDAAIENARRQAERKIAALKRQLTKLEELAAEPKWATSC